MISKTTGVFTLSCFITGFLITCLVMTAIPTGSAMAAGSGTVPDDSVTTTFLSSPGDGDMTWKFEVDTSTFKPDEYIITVSAVDRETTGTALFNLLEAGDTGRNTPPLAQGTASPPVSGYYILIDPVGNHYVGEKFTITGRTNLPDGTDLLVQVYSSSFKPIQKSQNGEFSGTTGTVQASSVGWWASSSSISSASAPPVAPLAPLESNKGAVSSDIKIIKTGSVTLEVTDITRTAGQFREMAIEQGGYVSSSSIQKNGGRQSGTVMLRIPQAHFEATMIGIKSAGTVKSVSTQGEDVTEEYVDFMAKKKSYEIQLEQYYVLMKKATRISDILAIQQQIDRVQTELNRLEGRLKYLNSRIDLSTITITLQEPEPVQVPTDTGHSFTTAINRGIEGLYGIIDTLIVATISLLPFLVIGGIGFGIYRRWKRNHPAKPAAEKDLHE